MGHWIITGATRGLGRHLARNLVQRGHALTFCGTNEDTVQARAQELAAWGRSLGVVGTLADPDFPARLVSEASRAFGHIDGIILNAATLGEPPLADVADIAETNFSAIFTINFLANLRLIQRLHTQWRSAGMGQVIALTSDAAHGAYPGWAAYGISKAALELLVLTYGAENAEFGVAVIDPTDMDTDMHRTALPDDEAFLRDPGAVAAVIAEWIDQPHPGIHRLIVTGDGLPLAVKEVSSYEAALFHQS